MPRRIYTPEMQAFIAENVQGKHYSELAELVSATFGIEKIGRASFRERV